jgi:hypothetical protein
MEKRPDSVQEQIALLHSTIEELRQEVDTLRKNLDIPGGPVERLLQQRGFPILNRGDQSRTLFPPAHAGSRREDAFYEHLRRYSFRLFLRDLIRYPEAEDASLLTRYCSLDTARRYLRLLADIGVVLTDAEGGYRLVSCPVASFGSTLEWYVCEIFRREFMAPALFNVRLGNTRHGGDYDVIASVFQHLVYVEVKSSPPRGVELPAVASFLNRLEDLRPNIAVFLVDTELRMKDKLVPLFEEALAPLYPEGPPPAMALLAGEIFHSGHRIYLMNSRKGIYSNLRRCFADYVKWDRKSVLSGTPREE